MGFSSFPSPPTDAVRTGRYHISHLGTVPYREALGLQEHLVDLRHRQAVPDLLLLLEHPPTLTLGRSARRDHLKVPQETLARMGLPVIETSRGGDITFHGPGQLIGYPIIDLNRYGRDIGRYLRSLEEVLIGVLRRFGLRANRKDLLTGVWVGDRKVASIGIAVRRWITYHGFSLNIDPEMDVFDLIVPCGLHGREMTSLRRLMGTPPDPEEVRWETSRAFCETFGRLVGKAESLPTGGTLAYPAG